jgi:starvation-inducible outer membrane lipoprotein
MLFKTVFGECSWSAHLSTPSMTGQVVRFGSIRVSVVASKLNTTVRIMTYQFTSNVKK